MKKPFQIDTHVVTATMRFADDNAPHMTTYEIFRGSRAQCKRIVNGIPDVYHESRKIDAIRIDCGTVTQWEAFLAQ